MRKGRWSSVVCWVFVGALAARGADRKPFDQLVPENAAFFLSLRNVEAARKWLETSPLAEVWKSREMQDFVKELAQQTAEQADDKESFREITKLLESFQGEVGIAVGDLSQLDFKGPQVAPPFVIIADASGDLEKARDAIKKISQRVRDRGMARITESEFRGTKVLTFDRKSESEGKEKAGLQAHLAEAQGLIILGVSKPFLQDVLANRSETSVKPLAENAEYKALREKFGKDAALTAFVNAGGLLQMLPKFVSVAHDAAAQQAAIILPGLIGSLGLSNLRSLWASATLGKEDVSFTYFASVSGPPRGIMKVFAVKPQSLKLPAVVPDDVASCSLLTYSPDALWELIEGVTKLALGFTAMSRGKGDDGTAPDPIAALESQLGIKLRQDLIGPLGGQILYYERISKKEGVSRATRAGISAKALLLDLKDREKFQTTLEKILAMAPFLKKSTYLGRPLYVPARSGGDTDAGDGDDPDDKASTEPDDESDSFAVAITENHLVLGMPRNLAEEAIRRVGKEVKSVSDTAGFKAVTGHLPPASTGVSYQSTASFQATLEILASLFTESAEGTMKAELPEGNRPPGSPDLDRQKKDPEERMKRLLRKLPRAESLAKPIAGFVAWFFSEDRGLGATSKVVFKKS